MRKKLYKIVIVILSLIGVLVLPSCDNKENESDTLTYYKVTEDWSSLDEVIEGYNKYCNKNYDDSYKIEI